MGDGEIPEDEALLDHLRQLARKIQGVPTPAEVYDEDRYSSLTYRDRFDSWADALKAAGVDKRSLLLHDLLRVRDEVAPEKHLRVALIEEGWFSLEDYEDFFGTIEEAEAAAESEASMGTLDPGTSDGESESDDGDSDTAAGSTRTTTDSAGEAAPSTGGEPSREALLEAIRDLRRKHGRVPTSTDLATADVPYSISDYSRTFGTWDEALGAAGIDLEQELSDELQRVTESVGEIPTRAQLDQRGAYSPSTYVRVFGSWDEAISQVVADGTSPEQSEPPSSTTAGSATQSAEEEPTDEREETGDTLDDIIRDVLGDDDPSGDDPEASDAEDRSTPKRSEQDRSTGSTENGSEPDTAPEHPSDSTAAQSLLRNVEHWVANHPPEGDIERHDVLRMWRTLRDAGRTTSNKLEQTLTSEGATDVQFADLVPYLQTVPGVERLEYGYWRYSGDRQTRNDLTGDGTVPTPELPEKTTAVSGSKGTSDTASPPVATAEAAGSGEETTSGEPREELIEALRQAAAETGGWPSIKEFRELEFDVQPEDVWKEFGTWNDGKRAADLDPSDRWGMFTEEPSET